MDPMFFLENRSLHSKQTMASFSSSFSCSTTQDVPPGVNVVSASLRMLTGSLYLCIFPILFASLRSSFCAVAFRCQPGGCSSRWTSESLPELYFLCRCETQYLFPEALWPWNQDSNLSVLCGLEDLSCASLETQFRVGSITKMIYTSA